MNLNDYQNQAMNSVAITEKNLAALLHRSLGLNGEAGEIANVIKKIVRDKDGKPDVSDLEKITEKLGDTLYYLAVLAEYFSKSLDEIALKNLEKSQKFLDSRK